MSEGNDADQGLVEEFRLEQISLNPEHGRYPSPWNGQLQTSEPGNIWIKFQANARDDIMIGLSPSKGVTKPMYEVIFGAFGNTEAAVRRSPGAKEVQRTLCGKLAAAGEFRHFWIHLKAGVLSMGVGPDLGKSTILRYEDTQPIPAAHVSFTSWASPVKLKQILGGRDSGATSIAGPKPVLLEDSAYIPEGIPPQYIEAYKQECERARTRAERFGTPYVAPDLSKFIQPGDLMKMQRVGHAEPGFVTGFDLSSEAEKEKRRRRMERFGTPSYALEYSTEVARAETANMTEEEWAHHKAEKEKKAKRAEKFGVALPTAISIAVKHLAGRKDPGENAERRPHVLHMYIFGRPKRDRIAIRSADIMAYFQGYGPSYLEWIDDAAVNVVFNDQHTAQRALVALSDELPKDPSAYLVQDTVEKSKEQREPMQASLTQEVVEGEVMEVEGVSSNVTEDPIGKASSEIDLASVGWRLGVPVKKRDGGSIVCQVLLRIATTEDQPPDKGRRDIYRRRIDQDGDVSMQDNSGQDRRQHRGRARRMHPYKEGRRAQKQNAEEQDWTEKERESFNQQSKTIQVNADGSLSSK